MTKQITGREQFLKWWIGLFGYAIISGLVMHFTLSDGNFHFHDPDSRVAFGKMVYGDVHKPFVYRAFVPYTVRVLTALTPAAVSEKLDSVWESKSSLAQYGYQGMYATEYTWAVIAMYLSLIGFGVCMQRMIVTFLNLSPFASYFSSITAVASVVLLRSFFVYDYVILFLFSCCILLLFHRDWHRFYPLFIIACLTKETAILLPFIVLLNRSEADGNTRAMTHFVAQSVIWLAVTLLVRFVYFDSPGSAVEFHLLDHNLPLVTKPASFLRFGQGFLPTGFNILLLSLVAVSVVFGWRTKPLFLRRSLWILAPQFGLALLFGWIDEIRMYYEAMPVVFCLCLHTAVRVFTEPDRCLR